MTVQGGKEFRRDLRRVREAFRGRTLERIATTGAKVIQPKARALAPRRIGVLAGGIIVVTKSRSSRKAVVGLTYSRDAFYGFSLEMGTGPRYTKKRGRWYRGVLPAHPHMRPAFDSEREHATEAARREADRVLKRILR